MAASTAEAYLGGVRRLVDSFYRGWLGMIGDERPGQGLKSQIAAAKRELEEKTTLTQQLDSELQKAGRAPTMQIMLLVVMLLGEWW